jgi:purine-binding chemotaxis protein CheW
MTNLLYLRINIAGRDVVLPASKVDSVVNIGDIIPVPYVEPHICGLFAMRSKVVTLIDSQWFITGKKADIADAGTGVVVSIDGHVYALMVDKVCDIFEAANGPKKLPSSAGSGWDVLGTNILEVDGAALLVIEPEYLIGARNSLAA